MTGALDRALPCAWDGAPIVWGAWSVEPWTTLVWHLDDDALACEGCGTIAPRRFTCEGIVQWPTTDPRHWDRTRTASTITAARCADCGHDLAHTWWDQESWELGPEDYGPAGSTTDPADAYTWEDD